MLILDEIVVTDSNGDKYQFPHVPGALEQRLTEPTDGGVLCISTKTFNAKKEVVSEQISTFFNPRKIDVFYHSV